MRSLLDSEIDAGVGHRESPGVADRVTLRAMPRDHSIALPLVGQDQERIRAIGEDLARAGAEA